MTDVVRRDIQRVWRQDCEDPGSEVRERQYIMLQPGNGAGYDQLTFLVPGLLRHETEARSFNLSSVFYLMSVCIDDDTLTCHHQLQGSCHQRILGKEDIWRG